MEFILLNTTALDSYFPYITVAAGIATAALFCEVFYCCCCARRGADLGERNSRLAMLLVILLADRPNRKYIQMAKEIGIDHMIKDDRVFQAEQETSESDE